MANCLYEVKLNLGRSNKNWQKFFENINGLNGISPDYAGINNVCLIAHHETKETIASLCSYQFRGGSEDLTVKEITKKTLAKENHPHRLYWDTVHSYFLPTGDFPNIQS